MDFHIPSHLPLKKYGDNLPVCPYCAQRFFEEAEECPSCGFSLESSKDKFPPISHSLRRIDDKAGCLKKSEREKLKKQLKKWEKKCPPVTLCLHIPALLGRQQLRQYSVWVLNKGVFNEVDFEISPLAAENILLLVIDIQNKSAVFSYGYQLDAYLSEDSLYPALIAGEIALKEGRYAEAIATIFPKALKILMRNIRRKSPYPFSPNALIHSLLDKLLAPKP